MLWCVLQWLHIALFHDTILQCGAACCSVVQRVEVCVAVAAGGNPAWRAHSCCSVLQCVAVCCSVLQCVAVRCSALQRNVVSYSVL